MTRSISFRYALLAALLLIALVFFSKRSAAQNDGVAEPELPRGYSHWSELCGIMDCEQYPVGYNTYSFGPHTYYFPTIATMADKLSGVIGVGVRPGRYLDVSDDETVRRSFSDARSLIITYCCHYLLTFYEMAGDFPSFREPGKSARMLPVRMTLSSHDHPNYQNAIQRGFGDGFDEFPPLESAVPSNTLSYNDDFWTIGIGEIDSRGFRAFRLLSKRPLLNGRRVYATCVRLCSFSTMSFAGDESETRPHVALRSMQMTQDNMFRCTAQEFENGCDPSPDAFDAVPAMLSVLEDMFDAATNLPNKEVIE